MIMKQDKIRCFVCIDLPREIIKEVERVQLEIKKKNLSKKLALKIFIIQPL